MDTILITGVNGFIGNELAGKCIDEGYAVVGIDRGYTCKINKVQYYQMNLYTEAIDELLLEYKPQIIIHCAGMADVNYSILYPDSDFATNVMITRKVLYSIKNNSPTSKFILLSSAAVYGNPNSLPITEDMQYNPISPYALHKVLIEEICNYFIKQFNIDIKILRIFSAYGIGLKKQILWDMGQKYMKTGKLEMFGTGNETRDFIHITDLVKSILIIIRDTKNEHYVYNIANGEEIKIKDIVEIFCDKCGIGTGKVFFSRQVREGNPSNWRASIDRIKEIGYQKDVDIESGIEEYSKWLRSIGVI